MRSPPVETPLEETSCGARRVPDSTADLVEDWITLPQLSDSAGLRIQPVAFAIASRRSEATIGSTASAPGEWKEQRQKRKHEMGATAKTVGPHADQNGRQLGGGVGKREPTVAGRRRAESSGPQALATTDAVAMNAESDEERARRA